MNNKEKYQRTFSKLHNSMDYLSEVELMKKSRKGNTMKVVAACAAAIVVLGSSTAAYANDACGIQRKIQLWINGDQTDVILDTDVKLETGSSSYTISYQDENGNTQEMGGGGVSIDENGKERPLTEDEMIEHLNEPDVEYKDDGTVWVYYMNQKVEITDKFDKDNVCHVKLSHNGKNLYLTVHYKDGYNYSHSRYLK